MNTSERRQSVLDFLRKRPGLRVPELALVMNVSEGTVRNDLHALEQQGALRRVHGGAVLNQNNQSLNNSFTWRCHQNAAAKYAIALEAAALINDGDSIMLDASSTAYYLAKALSKHRHLRVMTNGFEASRELAEDSSNTVILIGGLVDHESLSVVGILSEDTVAELRIQKAFLSCSGFTLIHGMMERQLAEAQLKRKVIESSGCLFALVDSSKFGKEDLISFVHPGKINHLFTDRNLSSDWSERLQQAGIEFTICQKEIDSL